MGVGVGWRWGLGLSLEVKKGVDLGQKDTRCLKKGVVTMQHVARARVNELESDKLQ